MFTLTINVPQDVLDATIGSGPNPATGSVQACVYGQLLAAWPPGNNIPGQLQAGQWVYYTGSDYAAVTANAAVPALPPYTTAGPQSITLPDVQIQAAHVLFGIGELPTILADGSGAPQQPNPITTQEIYDFVEFTYNLDDQLYINTSSIDQFGFPIQIQVTPPAANLPAGAGVLMDRASVFSNFQQYATGANAAFIQCAQDAFGNPLTTRILSPQNALTAVAPQGVTANVFTGPPSTLAPGTYYYAVTLLNQAGTESLPQPNVVAAYVMFPGQAVQVAWSPNADQDPATYSYNVYRGTPTGTSVTWTLIGNPQAADFAAGVAQADTGQAGTPQSPPQTGPGGAAPLTTWFDAQIQAFYAAQVNASTPLVLTATDGSSDGYVYTFQGATGTDTQGNPCLILTVTAVTASGAAVTDPPIPIGTPFYIYYPYWSTNTTSSLNPPPPPWTVYGTTPASVMVFAAEGVFADNAAQVPAACVLCGDCSPSSVCCVNLPGGVLPANSDLYSTLLGALENQIVSALTRGIANDSTINPQNWAVPPVQLTPKLFATDPNDSGSTSSLASTPYYYVITAENANGETTPSFEFNATPAAGTPFVQLNWQPVSNSVAQSFNVYRGTKSQQENILAGSIANPDGTTGSWTDNGASTTTQSPPVYFPPGVPYSAYDAFFHQPSVSINGAAYAGPFDDQGGQSSTLSVTSPTAVTITLGPWSS